MSNPIYDFVKLVLTIFSNLILDHIYKSPGLFEAMVEEDLELFPDNELSGNAFNFPLLLLPMV